MVRSFIFRCLLAFALLLPCTPLWATRSATASSGSCSHDMNAIPFPTTTYSLSGSVTCESSDTVPNPDATFPVEMVRNGNTSEPDGYSVTGSGTSRSYSWTDTQLHNGADQTLGAVISVKDSNGVGYDIRTNPDLDVPGCM